MKNKEDLLCYHCTLYVVCEKADSSFCLARDLFTHTEKGINEYCPDCIEGHPMTEEEFDN